MACVPFMLCQLIPAVPPQLSNSRASVVKFTWFAYHIVLLQNHDELIYAESWTSAPNMVNMCHVMGKTDLEKF